MRRSVVAFLALAFAGHALAMNCPSAPSGGPGGQPPQQAAACGHCALLRLVRRLNLSEDQKAQILAVERQGDRGAQRRRAILAILTPEQQQQLQGLEQQCQ